MTLIGEMTTEMHHEALHEVQRMMRRFPERVYTTSIMVSGKKHDISYFKRIEDEKYLGWAFYYTAQADTLDALRNNIAHAVNYSKNYKNPIPFPKKCLCGCKFDGCTGACNHVRDEDCGCYLSVKQVYDDYTSNGINANMDGCYCYMESGEKHCGCDMDEEGEEHDCGCNRCGWVREHCDECYYETHDCICNKDWFIRHKKERIKNDAIRDEAKKFYHEHLRPNALKMHPGKWIVIDGLSFDYEVGDGYGGNYDKLRERHSETVLWSTKIGEEKEWRN